MPFWKRPSSTEGSSLVSGSVHSAEREKNAHIADIIAVLQLTGLLRLVGLGILLPAIGRLPNTRLLEEEEG